MTKLSLEFSHPSAFFLFLLSFLFSILQSEGLYKVSKKDFNEQGEVMHKH